MTYYFPSLLPWIVSYFPHDQIFTRYEDGEEFNTCRTSFGAAGNENTTCCSRNVKNGMTSVLTDMSVILSLFPTSLALETSAGHLPEWQRSIPVKMGLFAKSSSSSPSLERRSYLKDLSTNWSWFSAQKKMKATPDSVCRQRNIYYRSTTPSGSLNWSFI